MKLIRAGIIAGCTSALTLAQSPASAVRPEQASSLRQYQDSIYRLPRGWYNGSRDGYVTCLPRDHDKVGFCTIWIGPTEQRTSDLDSWLTSKMQGVVKKDEKVRFRRELKRVQFGRGEVVMSGQSVNGDLQLHFGFQPKGHLVHVWFEGPADDKGKAATNDALMEVCNSLRFVSDGAEPLLGAPTPGDLQGTYWGSQAGYGIGGFEVQNRFWLFSPRGRFYQGLPVGRSLQTLDFDVALRREGDRCGNYRLEGKSLILAFANGEVETKDFARIEDGLLIGGTRFWSQKRIEDGLRLDGCWTSLHYQSFTPGSGVSGGVGSSQSLTLRKDGSFESEGFGFAGGNFESASGDLTGGYSTSSRKKKQSGKYEFKDGVLVLSATTGEPVTKNVFFLSPRVLLVDGASYIDKSKPDVPKAATKRADPRANK